MVQAQKAPCLHIPHSETTVDVSVIDTTGYVGGIPIPAFMQPTIAGLEMLSAPCYSVLIKHGRSGSKHKYDTLIWDLGIRKDWENLPTMLVDAIKGSATMVVKVEKDVATILRENGEDLRDVGAIIWSHHHSDHTGDPSTFPSSVDLIVGPGFKSAFVPGWPTNPEAPVHESAYEGRTLREIDFEVEGRGLMLGSYKAFDFYGDGSFYLLDTPGHAVGHMCALARTTADPPTFMFLGGDIAHHGGEFRPTEYLPLPEEIEPSPLVAPKMKSAPVCPGAIFEAIHPKRSRTESFMRLRGGEGSVHHDVDEAQRSIEKMKQFDGHENIFPVIAHDESLYDILDFYPMSANDWKAKGWKAEGLWRFLRDFDTGLEEHEPQWEPSIRHKK